MAAVNTTAEATVEERRRILVGADPEVFVRNKKTGAFISAHKMPGAKHRPFPVEYGALQVDGCALEFNIHPATTRKNFIRNLQATYEQLKAQLEKINPEAELAILPWAEFNKEYFSRLPKQVKQLGCDPDWNAYTMEENVMPKIKEPVRSAGGHVHIGWTSFADPMNLEHMYEGAAMVKQLDCTLFIGSLMWDLDHRRRKLYGQPGAFRPKEYGVEYRVLSNLWIGDEELAAWVYDTTIESIRMLAQGRFLPDDTFLNKVITEARENPNKFAEDRGLHEDAYWHLTGLGLPHLPSNCIQYARTVSADHA